MKYDLADTVELEDIDIYLKKQKIAQLEKALAESDNEIKKGMKQVKNIPDFLIL